MIEIKDLTKRKKTTQTIQYKIDKETGKAAAPGDASRESAV